MFRVYLLYFPFSYTLFFTSVTRYVCSFVTKYFCFFCANSVTRYLFQGGIDSTLVVLLLIIKPIILHETWKRCEASKSRLINLCFKLGAMESKRILPQLKALTLGVYLHI